MYNLTVWGPRPSPIIKSDLITEVDLTVPKGQGSMRVGYGGSPWLESLDGAREIKPVPLSLCSPASFDGLEALNKALPGTKG